MRSALFLLLGGCTGSPDEFNVSAGHNVASYDHANGSPAFDESGYSASLGFTWYLPTTAKRREEERDLEMIALLRGMERNTHDLALAHPAPEITVEAPTVELPKPEEDSIGAKGKAAVWVSLAALLGALTLLVKKVAKGRKAKGAAGK